MHRQAAWGTVIVAALCIGTSASAQDGKAGKPILEVVPKIKGAKGTKMEVVAGKCSLVPMDKMNSKRTNVSRDYLLNATVYGDGDKIKALLEAWKEASKGGAGSTMRLNVLPKLSGSPYIKTKEASLKSMQASKDGGYTISVVFPQKGISGDAPRVVGACLTVNR